MNGRFHRWRQALGIALVGCLLTAAMTPDVSYISATSFKISGFLGKLIAKAAPDEMRDEVFVSGNKMLTRNDQGATLIDLDARAITTINDKNKSYTVMTFEQMRALLAQQQAEQTPQDTREDDAEKPEAEVHVDFRLDRPGTIETINGYRAERFILTVLAEVTATNEDASKPREETEGGTFVLAMELWMSDAVAGYQEVQDFQRRYAEALSQTLTGEGGQQGMLEAIKAVIGNDPRLKEGLERAQKEAAAMEGMAVRTTTHFVTVPPGMDYDADQVFAQKKEEPKEKKKGGLGGFAKKLADKASDASGGGEPKQNVLLTTVTNLEGFATTPVPSPTFEIPAGYTEKPFMAPGSRQ